MVNGETRVEKRCVSCKRRGVMPSLGSPLPNLTSPLLPKMAPNHAQPWLLRNRKKNKGRRGGGGQGLALWEVAVPSVWGRRQAGAAAARRRAPPHGAWDRTPGRQGTESLGCGRPAH